LIEDLLQVWADESLLLLLLLLSFPCITIIDWPFLCFGFTDN
jgi:hypothetical protein